MKTIIQRYVGKTIGCNHKEGNIFRTVVLAGVTDTYFTLKEKEAIIHFPFEAIIYMAESEEGQAGLSVVGGAFQRPQVPFVIQVRSLIVGSVSVGVGAIF